MSGILFLRSAKDDEETDAYICAAQKEGFEAENVGVLSSVFVNEDALSLLLEQSQQKGMVATSARAVNALRRVWDGRPFFTVGPSAVNIIEQMGFTPSGSESGNASNLATFIVDNLNSSGPLLFLSGDKSLNILQERLKEAGISLDSIMAYTTGPNPQFGCQYESAAGRLGTRLKWIVFFSPPNMDFFLEAGLSVGQCSVESIGKTTSACLLERGIPVHVEAARPNAQSLLEAIVKEAK
ncbi:tetrapyrrole biosynthesis, uroporphyrinogen III synthase [Chytriomyces cf. hyalinus JEL632]|nr:tetrapyrrole biosynthesis, uroporphyrinogen III synthase [Chytriomyces cf. hyalinus JEL632]